VKTLDTLLDELGEPHGTFHDAVLMELVLDWPRNKVRAILDLWVGDLDSPSFEHRERRRIGALEIDGLLFWVEDPALPLSNSGALPGTWLTADGLLTEAPTEIGQQLAKKHGSDIEAWYLYFSDTNRFVYWAARDVTFSWASAV
jgi:hypothetical protein